MKFLHNDLGVMHRDIKLENLMFSDKSLRQVKIIDFGFSDYISPEIRSLEIWRGGSEGYIAPEL